MLVTTAALAVASLIIAYLGAPSPPRVSNVMETPKCGPVVIYTSFENRQNPPTVTCTHKLECGVYVEVCEYGPAPSDWWPGTIGTCTPACGCRAVEFMCEREYLWTNATQCPLVDYGKYKDGGRSASVQSTHLDRSVAHHSENKSCAGTPLRSMSDSTQSPLKDPMNPEDEEDELLEKAYEGAKAIHLYEKWIEAEIEKMVAMDDKEFVDYTRVHSGHSIGAEWQRGVHSIFERKRQYISRRKTVIARRDPDLVWERITITDEVLAAMQAESAKMQAEAAMKDVQ